MQGSKSSVQHKILLLSISSILAFTSPAFAAIKLSPQSVVDMALQKGLRAKGAELTAQRSYVVLQRALGVYDFSASIAPGYTYTQAENLNGTQYPVDKTFQILADVTKKFSTGTTVSLDFQQIGDNATLPSYSTTVLRSGVMNLDSLILTVRQNLWQNAFGYADRLGVEIGRQTVDAALETREENLEGILLDAMTLFWNAYTAQEELKQNMAAREKYQQLVVNVRRKAGFNLNSPGELPRLEAELQGTEQRVKSSSAAYLNAVDTLLTSVEYHPAPPIGAPAEAAHAGGTMAGEPVELEVPTVLPPVPQLAPVPIENLRAVRVAKVAYENAQRGLDQVVSNTSPKFDIVAKAGATGVDEQNSRAVSELASSAFPTYYIGVEFSTPFDSALVRGTRADARIQLLQSQNDFLVQEDLVRDQLKSLERQVASQYSVTKSVSDTVTLRERVVREIESAYRQGRQPLVEVIRAYNDLFSAQLDSARSIGQYHILLNQLAASRDELVTNVR